jgi:hypothetical protein
LKLVPSTRPIPPAAQGRTTEAGFTVGEVTFGGTIELIIFVGILIGLFGADAIAAARTAGISWSKIGELLGTSAQAAQQRYGAVVEQV